MTFTPESDLNQTRMLSQNHHRVVAFYGFVKIPSTSRNLDVNKRLCKRTSKNSFLRRNLEHDDFALKNIRRISEGVSDKFPSIDHKFC